jgi:hypothetical protein
VPNKNCPTQTEFSSFISRETAKDEREKIESHLADCAECRSGLALMFGENGEDFTAPASLKEKVKNLSAEESKADAASFFSFDWLKTNRLPLAFASVLTVCFAFAGFYVLQDQTPPDTADVLRNGASKNDSFTLLAPEDGANLADEKITFRWSELPGVKNYTLILSDEKGDIVREISSEKPFVETPLSGIGLIKNKRYFWYVRAKFADGLTAESESRRLIFVHK